MTRRRNCAPRSTSRAWKPAPRRRSTSSPSASTAAPGWSQAPGLRGPGVSPRPGVLFASHAAGGGVSRHLEDLAHAIRDDAEVLWLRPSYGGHLTLTWLRAGETLALTLRADEDEQALVAL